MQSKRIFLIMLCIIIAFTNCILVLLEYSIFDSNAVGSKRMLLVIIVITSFYHKTMYGFAFL